MDDLANGILETLDFAGLFGLGHLMFLCSGRVTRDAPHDITHSSVHLWRVLTATIRARNMPGRHAAFRTSRKYRL
jgi:hypothetical protein